MTALPLRRTSGSVPSDSRSLMRTRLFVSAASTSCSRSRGEEAHEQLRESVKHGPREQDETITQRCIARKGSKQPAANAEEPQGQTTAASTGQMSANNNDCTAPAATALWPPCRRARAAWRPPPGRRRRPTGRSPEKRGGRKETEQMSSKRQRGLRGRVSRWMATHNTNRSRATAPSTTN
jgi:hypothetical protein